MHAVTHVSTPFSIKNRQRFQGIGRHVFHVKSFRHTISHLITALFAEIRHHATPTLLRWDLRGTSVTERARLVAGCLGHDALRTPLVQPLRVTGHVAVVRSRLFFLLLLCIFYGGAVPRSGAQDAGDRREHLRVSPGLKVA